MKVGTKSLLFGAHQFIIHPALVFIAWWKLYGFPWDPRLWLTFIVHDWGYWGLSDMDGEQGQHHQECGARIMRVFGDRWYFLGYLHSRHLCSRIGLFPSRLCIADKYVIVIEPAWIYLPRARLSGELAEYTGGSGKPESVSDLEWLTDLKQKLKKWVETNKDRTSTW